MVPDSGWVGGATMRTPELQARHRASTVVCQMLLICCHAALQGYNRDGNKNIAVLWPEILTIMAIRVAEAHRRPPISINRLARLTGLSRRTVARSITHLVRHGVIEKKGEGYIGCDAYMQARLNARYFKHMVAAIKAASRELRDYR
jgi:DNA-binding transcriptional ArsR family regulator